MYKHGSPGDRGSADAYYGRPYDPHYWPAGTGQGQRVEADSMTASEILEYTEAWDNGDWNGDGEGLQDRPERPTILSILDRTGEASKSSQDIPLESETVVRAWKNAQLRIVERNKKYVVQAGWTGVWEDASLPCAEFDSAMTIAGVYMTDGS